MTDSILIKNIKTKGVIGAYAHERQQKQPLILTVRFWTDLSEAGKSDCLADTIDYEVICNAMLAHIEQKQPALLEKLATELIDLCFQIDDRIQAIRLLIKKPKALKDATAAVSLFRKKAAYSLARQ